jgi:hypothetical protein
MKTLAFLTITGIAQAADLTKPIAPRNLVFEEKDGVVAFEAEHFIKQDLTKVRAWYLTTADKTPDIKPDPDPPHVAGASGGAYLEILPDTRVTHDDKLTHGESFSGEPGKLAVLSYKVHFNTPGTYWIWARAYCTGSEDNGMHFGINGDWPETAQRWQTVTRNRWHWRSAQRTNKVHIGVPGILTLDVPKPGVHTIQVSMREDGIELDKILLVNRKDHTPDGLGPDPVVKSGKIPDPFPFTAAENNQPSEKPREVVNQQVATTPHPLSLAANSFDLAGSGFYLDRGKWAAINPNHHKTAKVATASPFPAGKYHLTLEAIGESDGSSTYTVRVNGSEVGRHTCPLGEEIFSEDPKHHATFRDVTIDTGDVIEIEAAIASADGKEFSRARWAALRFVPADDATKLATANFTAPAPAAKPQAAPKPPLQLPRQPDGSGTITITGETHQWHKLTLTLDGPYACELDTSPNPFTDHSFWVTFTHESGAPALIVPGHFAADGNAAESSAKSGTRWRVHFAPEKTGTWSYTTTFLTGKNAAFRHGEGQPIAAYHGKSGSVTIAPSGKTDRDLRAHGRLAYVGKHHLRFMGSGQYFLKAGPDAPETLLAYADFDDTSTLKPKVPVKTWQPHVRDWTSGDPTWKNGKGKGLIGALNYLAEKGMNAFSFLPYNVDGDGSNIWPFTSPREKFHYDCSKLDQWGIVFDHATTKGLYLHFKLQENEIDDNRRGQEAKEGGVPASLDGGKLGPERMLYCREIISRFGHALALNWNIGEENTQSTQEIKDMIEYIRSIDPYQHHIVLHTFPNQQDRQYEPLLGYKPMTGVSLQNEWNLVHRLTAKWVRKSAQSGHPWVCANDEQGNAGLGVPPDPGYPGKTQAKHSIHDIRKFTLWGNLMAGGAGVEYYFGYQLAENDLVAEDWRSRDQSWTYANIALRFFQDRKIPFQEMTVRNELIGNAKDDNSRYCLAKDNEIYLIYLPNGGTTSIELPADPFTLTWFNPRSGETGETAPFAGKEITASDTNDWLAIIQR